MFRPSPQPPRKRRRDEDEDFDRLSADEGRSEKKCRSAAPIELTLQQRQNPSVASSFPRTITPSDSEGSSADSPGPHAVILSPPNELDVEMDDDDLDMARSQSPDSPLFSVIGRPARLNPQPYNDLGSEGRIPTPIHSSFYIQHLPRSTSDVSLMDLGSGLPAVSSFRKQPERDRRMPSPISEDEVDTPTHVAGSQLSRLSVNEDEGMEVDFAAEPPPPTAAAPAKKGRARSGAITEKRKFSMGYRDDCEKCRARVPGHYSHFLPA